MNDWIMLEFERGREMQVFRNMTRLGITYYYATEFRAVRAFGRAQNKQSQLAEYPILPGLLFLRGAAETGRKAMSTQYTERVVVDLFEQPLEIPAAQIERFREAVAAHNEKVRAKHAQGLAITKDDRKKFVKMTQEALAQFKAREFGKEAA